MKIEQLHALADMFPDYTILDWERPCHDCGTVTKLAIHIKEDGFHLEGDGIPFVISPSLDFDPEKDILLKCKICYEKEPVIHYQDCEVYSRIVGYMRPVDNWNGAKKAEFRQRKTFDRCLCNNE